MSEEEKHKIFTVNVQGVPFPGPPFDPAVLEGVLNFKPDAGDILVATYPKCGTAWMQYIIWEIINQGIPPPDLNKMMFREFPFLEVTGLDAVKGMIPPRLIKTHLPFHLLSFNPSSKYVYLSRNPLDCCVSYYHHTKDAAGTLPDMTFDDFFNAFVEGKVPFGDFFDHVLLWYTHRNDPNVLFLTYEDLKKDPRSGILNIARFLGDAYFSLLKKDEQVLTNCLKHTDFTYMKNLKLFFPKVQPMGSEGIDMKNVPVKSMEDVDQTNVDPKQYRSKGLFRKGIVGDWKNYFSEAQKLRFNQYMLKKLRGTEMEGFWSTLEDDDGRQE